MSEEKKGIERDISVPAQDANGGPVYDFKKSLENGQPDINSRYEARVVDIVIKALNLQKRDETPTLDDIRKRMKLVSKLRKYGDRPISLKLDTWKYIRDRLVSLGFQPCIISQLDQIIDGEYTDKDLEDL